MCVAAICLGLAPNAEAGERSGLVHRASCTVVRFYVATEAEIEAARHCIKDTPTQTVQAVANWAAQWVEGWAMKGHLTRNRLIRRIAGAVSLLVLTGIAIFGIARHFVT
jgi:hypothetical protein